MQREIQHLSDNTSDAMTQPRPQGRRLGRLRAETLAFPAWAIQALVWKLKKKSDFFLLKQMEGILSFHLRPHLFKSNIMLADN